MSTRIYVWRICIMCVWTRETMVKVMVVVVVVVVSEGGTRRVFTLGAAGAPAMSSFSSISLINVEARVPAARTEKLSKEASGKV